MIGNTNNPSAGPAIKALAIGMPLTTDFCDPQKTIALSSARSNRRARLPLIIISSAVARSTASISANMANVGSGNRCQRPCTTDALNAAYTINKIEPLSVTEKIARLRSAHWPIHGRNS